MLLSKPDILAYLHEGKLRFDQVDVRLSEDDEARAWVRPDPQLRSARIPSHVLANLIEESIAQDLVIRQIAREGDENPQVCRELGARYEAKRARRTVAGFNTLKKSPSPPIRRARYRRKSAVSIARGKGAGTAEGTKGLIRRGTQMEEGLHLRCRPSSVTPVSPPRYHSERREEPPSLESAVHTPTRQRRGREVAR